MFGLSVETRSYLLLLVFVFAWWIARKQDCKYGLAPLLWFLGGFVIGSVPSLYLFIYSPDAFLFDNLRYHAIRSSGGLIGWWQEKLVVLVQMFLGSRESNGLQWSILFFVSAGLVTSAQSRRSSSRIALQIALALMVICLLPTPAYAQYFSLCMPFLIVGAVCGCNELFARLESRREKLAAAIACVCVLIVYVAASLHDFRAFLFTGDGVPGVERAQDRGDWRMQRVIEVSQAVDQITRPGEVVASFWPGDIFQAKVAPLSGLENPFALPVSEKLTSEQRNRYHIISPVEIESDFAAHRVCVVVLRSQILAAVTADELRKMQGVRQAFRDALDTDGYTLVRSIGGISIYSLQNRDTCR